MKVFFEKKSADNENHLKFTSMQRIKKNLLTRTCNFTLPKHYVIINIFLQLLISYVLNSDKHDKPIKFWGGMCSVLYWSGLARPGLAWQET